jgi:hypothetical protein
MLFTYSRTVSGTVELATKRAAILGNYRSKPTRTYLPVSGLS